MRMVCPWSVSVLHKVFMCFPHRCKRCATSARVACDRFAHARFYLCGADGSRVLHGCGPHAWSARAVCAYHTRLGRMPDHGCHAARRSASIDLSWANAQWPRGPSVNLFPAGWYGEGRRYFGPRNTHDLNRMSAQARYRNDIQQSDTSRRHLRTACAPTNAQSRDWGGEGES